MKRIFQLFLITLTSLALLACSKKLDFKNASLNPLPDSSSRQVLLTESVDIELDNMQTFRLAAGSRWEMVGRLPPGIVYRPVNTTLLIAEGQVFDAFLIVSEGNDRLQGFYLPVKRAYVQLKSPIPLSLQK